MARPKKSVRQTTARNTSTLPNNAENSSASSHPHGKVDEDQEYQIRSILAETKTHYRIEWEGLDPATDKPYDQTWEPRCNANEAAVKDWEKKKAAKAAAKSAAPKGRGQPRKVQPERQSTGRRGRPRNVVESSPVPEESIPPAADTEVAGERENRRVNDELEIGESQPTIAGVQDESEPESSLFIPAESPKPAKEHPAVQVSDPPSSYAGGGYQTFPSSSSQIPETVIPRRRQFSPDPLSLDNLRAEPAPAKKSPEASQWQPEEGDTSKTTAQDTTDVSLDRTASSQPVVPSNSGHNSTKIVPDSQSVPNSSSFVPSTAGTKSSSSAPQATGRSLAQESAGGVVPSPHEQYQPGESSEESQETGAPQSGTSQQIHTRTFISNDSSGGSAAGGVQVEPDTQSVRSAQDQPPSSPLRQAQSSASQQLKEELVSSRVPQDTASQAPQSASQRQASPAHSSDSRIISSPHRTSSQKTLLDDGKQSLTQDRDLIGDFVSQAELPISAQRQTLERQNSTQPSNLDGTQDSTHQQNGTSSQLPSQSAKSGTSQQYENRTSPQDTLQDRVPPADSSRLRAGEHDIRETTEGPEAPYVDLTTGPQTQPPPASTSSISVTPLPPRHLQGALNQTHPQESPSSFPFQTQIHPTSLTSATGSRAQRSSQFYTDNNAAPDSRSSPGLSSSIPQPPSHSVGTFGESAPARPEIPSSPAKVPSRASTMDASPDRTQIARQKVADLRARKNAKRLQPSPTPSSAARPTSAPGLSQPKPSVPPSSVPPSSVPPSAPQVTLPPKPKSPLLKPRDGARSPSVVPAMEVTPVITTEEMNTSERYRTLIPQASEGDEVDKQRNGSVTTVEKPQEQAQHDPERDSAHVLPISLGGHQRDQYPQTIYYHRELIQKVLEARDLNGELMVDAQHFLNHLRWITLHPDLDNPETYSQYDVEPSQQASWDVSCSAKFRFLERLLKGLRNESLKVVIALPAGRPQEIMKTFLEGIGISHSLHNDGISADHSGSDSSLRVATMAPNVPSTTWLGPNGVDLVLALDNSVSVSDELIRSLRNVKGKWRPFASLVVPNSVEHIERGLAPTLSEQARVRALVSGVNQLKQVGSIDAEAGQMSTVDAADALAAYFKTDAEHDARWPLVGLEDLVDLDSQTESEIEPPNESSAQTGEKRPRGSSDAYTNGLAPDKRARLDGIPPDDAPPEVLPATVNMQEVEISHISDSVENHTQAQPAGVTEPEQQQDRIQELETALADLQFRFEDQRAESVQAKSRLDQAISMAQSLKEQLVEQLNKTSVVRNERAELKEQLEQANNKLLSHVVPERVEFETLRLAKDKVQAELVKSDKRLEQANKQLEYVREMYQEASTAAQKLTTSHADVQNQLAFAENRATGELARLRQVGYDTRMKHLEAENRKLKAVLKDREAGMKFRDEEIAKYKAADRGRMGTRGSSLPRSPRLGSPMRSRQSSPAAGEVKRSLLHPLRNAGA